MAGFFGFFDYTKPGPGVPKDGPPKARIVVFFEIFQRKFWNLIKMNLMFNLFNIPATLIGLFVALQFFPGILVNTTAASDSNALISEILLKFMVLSALLCIPVITVGPAQAGFTYVLRNYAREEHAFIWGDFKDIAIKNFKQSMIVSIIDFFAGVLMILAIIVYAQMGRTNIVATIGSTLMIMMLLIFTIMHMYIYPMLVTFHLSLKQLYKNALIFAIVKLFPNLGILLLSMLIIFLTFLFNSVVGLILYAFITVSLIGLITNFYVYPKLQKYMMRNDEEEEASDGEEDEYEEDEEDEDENENEEDGLGEIDDDSQKENESDAVQNKEGEDEVKRYF